MRPGYLLNGDLPAFSIFSKDPASALTDFRAFPQPWTIDWRFFADLEVFNKGDVTKPADPGNRNRLQFAYRIVAPLGALPPSILPTGVEAQPESLAARNLAGGGAHAPSEAVVRARGLVPLADAEITLGSSPRSRGHHDDEWRMPSAARSRATVRSGPTCWPKRGCISSRPQRRPTRAT